MMCLLFGFHSKDKIWNKKPQFISPTLHMYSVYGLQIQMNSIIFPKVGFLKSHDYSITKSNMLGEAGGGGVVLCESGQTCLHK